MFSRIFSSVRGVLPGQIEEVSQSTSSPPTESIAQPEIIRELRGRKIATPSPKRVKKMVATRRQSSAVIEPETPGMQLREETRRKAAKEATPKSAVKSTTPSSSSRKRRKISGTDEEAAETDVVDDTTPIPKSGSRRSKRVASQRESREGTEESETGHTNSHFEKTLPLSSLSQEVLPDDNEQGEGVADALSNTDDAEVVAEPEKKMEKVFEAVVVPALPSSSQIALNKPAKTKTGKRSKATDFFGDKEDIAMPDGDEEKEEAVTELIEKAKGATPKNKRKRFGSEELAPVISEPLIAPEPAVIQDSENTESSEDEAPEVVSTTTAQEQVKKVEREASKAVEKQEAAIRQKRREKAQIKAQAAEAAKKRKVIQAPPSPSESSGSVIDENDLLAPLDHELAIQDSAPATRLAREELPTYLPESYLEDEDDESSPPPHLSMRQHSRPNKIKFLDEPKIRDVVRGNTKIRVSKKDVEGLAPKVNKRARNLKEEWLQGRAGRDGKLLGGGIRKKQSSGGFFVKK